jgi:AcrR family transcriptional regulator
MSKSGVFAHFGSREELQLAVIESAATRFGEAVLTPALSQPRGLPRLRAIMHNWFEWVRSTNRGGCVLMSSVTEYDDRPAHCMTRCPQRNALARRTAPGHRTRDRMRSSAPGDSEQYAFELYSIPLTSITSPGCSVTTNARVLGERAVERWFAANSP